MREPAVRTRRPGQSRCFYHPWSARDRSHRSNSDKTGNELATTRFSLPFSPPADCQISSRWFVDAHVIRKKPPQNGARTRICAPGSEPKCFEGWVAHPQKAGIRSQNPRLCCHTSNKRGRQTRAWTAIAATRAPWPGFAGTRARRFHSDRRLPARPPRSISCRKSSPAREPGITWLMEPRRATSGRTFDSSFTSTTVFGAKPMVCRGPLSK